MYITFLCFAAFLNKRRILLKVITTKRNAIYKVIALIFCKRKLTLRGKKTLLVFEGFKDFLEFFKAKLKFVVEVFSV